MLISFILAVPDCPLNAPKSYYGTVSYEDILLSGNYEINAMMGSNYAGVGNVIDGNYQIDISPCYGITGTIYFYINTIKAEEEGSYVGMDDWGKNENLNLILWKMPPSENPPCGNGIKNPGEVCDEDDFGALTCSNYGFNSGSLTCSDSCDYIYTDNCYNSNDGDDDDNGNGGSPGGGSPSSDTPITITSGTTDTQISDEESETIDLISNKIQETKSSGITGAVTGFVKSGKGIASISFVMFVIVLVVMIMIVENKKK